LTAAVGRRGCPVVGGLGIAVAVAIRVVVMVSVLVVVVIVTMTVAVGMGIVVVIVIVIFLVVAAGEVGGAEGLVASGGGEVRLVFVFGVLREAGGDIFGAADLGFVLVRVEDAFIGGAAANGLTGGGGGRAVGQPGAEAACGAEAGGSPALLESLMSHG
jgi:hypothetical protein